MVRVHAKVIHRTTRQQRRRARAGVILSEAGLSERTKVAYLTALQKLLPELEDVQGPAQLDSAVANWVERAWEDGETLYVVSNALCGLHFFEPMTKHCIPSAWRLFATWRKLEWPSRAPPLTCGIVMSLANYAVSHGDIFFAALLRLGFFGLLRTGELMSLVGTDLLCNRRQLLISLKGTKSGKRNAADETVAVENDFTLLIVSTVLDILTSRNALSHKLWEFSPQSFRNHFDAYLRRFNIQHLLFRPYSLRRGGATHLFQVTGSMEVALVKGRWSSNKVARVYISDGLSKLPDLVLDKEAKKLLAAWHPRSCHHGNGDRGK